MPWDSVNPYHGSHLMSTRTMFCSYDFTLEQLDETCSRKTKKQTKKSVFGSFCFACCCCQSCHSAGAKVTLPSSACMSYNRSWGVEGQSDRVSTYDITHRLRGKLYCQRENYKGRFTKITYKAVSVIYILHILWHIYSTEYAAKYLYVDFLWCEVFEKKIQIFFFCKVCICHT